MRQLLDFGLGATDLTVAFIFGMRGRPIAAAFLGFVGGALVVSTLMGAR